MPEIAAIEIEAVPEDDPGHRVLAHAPVLHGRPNTVGRFTDVPLLMWAEVHPMPEGSTHLRYSVVFSNEDGGTPPDRLMATWGRLTDIEFVYGVELDASGTITASRYQAMGHEIVPFAGVREARHPILYVVTDNNMLADMPRQVAELRGPPRATAESQSAPRPNVEWRGSPRPVEQPTGTGRSAVRFAPAPFRYDLSGVSREAVMDAHPWTYRISSDEARREGRVAAAARPGSGKVPDPRRFAFVEACAETRDASLAFGVAVAGPDGATEWQDSDGGLPAFRIIRSPDHFPNGCFRGAVALPEGTRADQVRALRLRAHTRAPREGEAPLPPGAGAARWTRVNRLFLLGPDDRPGPNLLEWSGDVPLQPEGPAHVVPVLDQD